MSGGFPDSHQSLSPGNDTKAEMSRCPEDTLAAIPLWLVPADSERDGEIPVGRFQNDLSPENPPIWYPLHKARP